MEFSSVYALRWNKVYGLIHFCFTQRNNKCIPMPLTSRKHTCGFLHCFHTFAGCHTDSKCDNAYSGLRDVFAYDTRLHHPCVQFAASVTKPSSDKIKEGSKWCTARWYVFFLANLTLSGVRNINWNKDVTKQLRSHTVLLRVLLLVFTIGTAHSRKEPFFAEALRLPRSHRTSGSSL